MLSPGALFQSHITRKGANSNVSVDVYCSWCYSWRKLHESGRLVLAYGWMLCVAYNLESNKGEITMTENEAIKVLVTQKQCIDKSSSGQCKINCGDCKKNIPIAYQEKSYEVAITALKEIQQYREIGTVEECRKAVENKKKCEKQWHNDMENPLEPIKVYSALKSEILKLELRIKNRPKDISILDYTVIAALQKVLKNNLEAMENE